MKHCSQCMLSATCSMLAGPSMPQSDFISAGMLVNPSLLCVATLNILPCHVSAIIHVSMLDTSMEITRSLQYHQYPSLHGPLMACCKISGRPMCAGPSNQINFLMFIGRRIDLVCCTSTNSWNIGLQSRLAVRGDGTLCAACAGIQG